MRKIIQWIGLVTLMLFALAVSAEPANAASDYVEVATFSQLKAALTNPAGAKVKLLADISISTSQAQDTDIGISLGEGHYTLNLNGYTLQYHHIGGIGDPEGVPLEARYNRSFTLEGPGSLIGGTYGFEQANNQSIFYMNGGTLQGVIGSGMRMTGGLAYLRGGTINGNFYSVFHEDGIVVSQGTRLDDKIVKRSMGPHVYNYGVIENQILTGAAVLENFVLVLDQLTIAQGSSLRVERQGGIVVHQTFQNHGTYTYNGGLQSIGGQATLKSEAQVRLYESVPLDSLTLEPQAYLRVENQAVVTVQGPFVSRNGGIEVMSGELVLLGSIENTGTAVGVPQLAEQHSSGTGQPPVEDHSQPANWAASHIDAARTSWLPESHLFSFYQNNIRREEFAELVVRLYEALAGREAPLPQVNPFSDIDLLHVQKAAQLGIVTGRGGGLFDPFGLITRQEMATMYYRLLNALQISPVVTMDYVLFADEGFISEYAKAPLQLMYKIGIIMGEGIDHIVMAPLRNSSRETALVISNRIYTQYK